MKHLLTLTALLISSLAMAQMPYNPDSNGDDLIGSEDLLTFLGVYNTTLMQPDLQCDYEGTELEQLLAGLFSETLILDSMYIEYILLDSVQTYFPGCPEPVMVETELERSYMIDLIDFYPTAEYLRVFGQMNYLGFTRQFTTRFHPEFGGYYMEIRDDEVGYFTNFPETARLGYGSEECCGVASPCCSSAAYLPFPSEWLIDEEGIHIGWRSDSWVSNCEHFRVIPYWHEAE